MARELKDFNGDPVEEGDFIEVLEDGVLGQTPAGMILEVGVIQNRNSNEPSIGIVRKDSIETWHDLNGHCPNGHGYWIRPIHLRTHFRLTSSNSKNFVVKKSLEFKGQSLKGYKCRYLQRFDKGSFFAEFEKNIRGMGCDGLGKQGHCMVINNDAVEAVGEKKEKRKRKRVRRK